MSLQERRHAQARRAIRAVLIVAALVLVVPISDFACSAFWAGRVAAETASAAWNPSHSFDVGAVFGVDSASGSVPLLFEEETFALTDFEDLKCSADGSVLSFVVKSSSNQAFRDVRTRLEQSGWVCQESGAPNMASFFKATGRYRWMFVSCSQAGGRTSVVLQGIRQYGEKGSANG